MAELKGELVPPDPFSTGIFGDGIQSQEPEESHETNRPITKANMLVTLRLLNKISPLPGQEFCVFAYFLLDKISSEGCHGLWMFIGAYCSYDLAKERATKLIRDIKVNAIYVMKSCDFQEITEKFIQDRVSYISTTKKGIMNDIIREKYQEEIEAIKKREEVNKEVEEEIEREGHSDTIEYYARNWYLAISNEGKIKTLEKQLEETKKNYQMRIDKIRTQYAKQPEMEDKWIPLMTKKLTKRDEKFVLSGLIDGHERLKDLILNKTEENENILC